MEKLYVITHDDGWNFKSFYYKDLAMAIIQFKTFLEQEGQVYLWDWELPIRVEYGENWLKLSEEEFWDNAIYSL